MTIRNLPFVLITIIIASSFLHPMIPYDIKCMIYAVSLTAKSVVLFVLPFVIFGLLFKTFVKLSTQAATIFFLIFCTLCVSNFISTFLSRNVGMLFYRIGFNFDPVSCNNVAIIPYFLFLVPNLIKNEIALFSGVFAGFFVAIYNKKLAISISEKIEIIIQKLFSVISFLIPLFIIGFVVKSASDGNLTTIVKNYFQILLVFMAYASLYIFIFYLIVNRFLLMNCLSCLRNMIPAWLTAISTMSSALAMPLTILSTGKNVKNKELAGSVISATVNIHLLGDCLFIPTIAYALLKNYGLEEPSLYSYFVFTIFFVIAKFSVAAVPAGGIMVMIPILEEYLKFTHEMSTLITAIYIIFDPIITGFNVLGNGAFAKLIDNINKKA